MLIETLSQWGVIEATGDDARSFLQTQLTQDVASLAPDRATLAGYCTAKGRMLGQFLVVRQADRVLLLTHRDLADGLVKRLSMFVLRLKCKLKNVSANYRIQGLTGAPVNAIPGLTATSSPLPDMLSPFQVHSGAHTSADGSATLLIGWPSADGTPRHLLLTPLSEDVSQPVAAGLPDDEKSVSRWQIDDIRCAIPFLTPENVEAFVPQMVNLDLIGGVSFSKGCYPGQEIVARSHYLGKMKRRMQIGTTSVPLQPGQDIFSSAHAGEAAGRVVNAASDGEGSCYLLFEVNSDLLENGTLHAGAADGPLIALAKLPYDIPAPVTPPGRH